MATTTTTPKPATATLPKEIFAVEVANHELLKLAYNAYLANGRGNYAKTLKRGEVSGGGKKPHKQKGTGRARAGSTRSPIWRKGGITFGPTGNENYKLTVPVAAKRLAVRQALSLAHKAKVITVVDNVKTTGKTAEVAKYLAAQKVAPTDNVVLVVDTKPVELVRASRNIANLQVVQASYLNVFTIMNADKILMTKPSLKAVAEWLGA